MPSINLRPSLNSLLAALPPPEYERLVPNLQLLSLDLGETLSEPGCPMDDANKNACSRWPLQNKYYWE